jgi:hypothetical protein
MVPGSIARGGPCRQPASGAMGPAKSLPTHPDVSHQKTSYRCAQRARAAIMAAAMAVCLLTRLTARAAARAARAAAAAAGCAAASLMTRVACCGEHTTHSGHPAFLPEYPARVAASLGAAGKEYAVSNFGFPTAVVTEAVSRPAEAGGGKARLYSETEPARLCAAWRPDVVVLGPFGKHDALGPFSTHDT